MLAVPASAAPASGASSGGNGLTVSVAGAYDGSVPSGSWVPVAVTATAGGQGFDGAAVVTTGAPQSGLTSGGGCVPVGNGPIRCYATSGIFPGNPFSGPGNGSTTVTYRLPLDIAPQTTKHLAVDLLASSAPVHVALVDAGGTTEASADGTLGVALGVAQPSVALVSDDPSTLGILGGIDLGQSGQVQVVHLSPSGLPTSGALLGGFTAVVLDQATTEGLVPAQRQALSDYVTGGGSLLVAGGLGWKATAAGLPASLVPAAVGATRALALPVLAGLLGAPVPSTPVELTLVRPLSGSSTTYSEGSTPLVVQARRGAGQVLELAMDPASAPLAAWPGTTTLLRRLLTPAAHVGQNYQGPVFSGASSSRAQEAAAFGPVLTNIPDFSLPSAGALGLLLVLYVLAIGPINFLVLGRLRRRDLAWVSVPALSLVAAGLAYGTGLGTGAAPSLNQVRVITLAPGSSRAAVDSYAALYLPHGGGVRIATGAALVSDLPSLGPTSAALTVSAGPSGSAAVVGGNASLGALSATGHLQLPGPLDAQLTQSSGTITGVVTDHLGVSLSDVSVFTAPGRQVALGSLAAGASTPVHLAAASSSAPTPYGLPYGMYAKPGLLGNATSNQAGRAQLRQQQETSALTQIGYQDAARGPVLVGLARDGGRLPPDLDSAGVHASVLDAVVMPLDTAPAAGTALRGLPGTLVDVVQASQGGPVGPMGPVQVGPGGSAVFRFDLPGRAWKAVRIDFGARPVNFQSFQVFDIVTGAWVPATATSSVSGAVVTIPHPASQLGAGGSLVLRAQTAPGQSSVLLSEPTLDADPAVGAA